MTALPDREPPRAVHVFVDLENNQPTLDEVRALVPDLTDVWLFHSGKQNKHLAAFESLGPRQMAVPIARPGKNSLDFHLSFYLGYIAAKNPGALARRCGDRRRLRADDRARRKDARLRR